jgi:hypothetical protein
MPVPVLKTAITRGRSKYAPITKHVCSLLLQALITIPCLSQTIGNWTFNNTITGTGSTNNTVSTADFSAGIPGRAFNGGGEYFGEGGWPAGALNTGAYLQFSITPNTGYQLDLTNIVLRIRRSNTGTPAGSGPTSWSLRSSLDGFAADIASNTLVHTYSNYTVTLGSAFLNVYSTVTFRLYGFNSTSPADGQHRVVLDNISVQGIGELLPLTLTGIQAAHSNEKNIAVKWQVNNVREGSVFNVERSVNGSDFTTVNRFIERESRSAFSYSYEDGQVPGEVKALYYRVKINEPSGWTYFSWLVKVDNKAINQLLVDYTTVQGQSLLSSLQIPEKGMYTVSVISMNGALLQQRTLDLEPGVHVITLPLDALAHGTYVVRVGGNRFVDSRKFVY